MKETVIESIHRHLRDQGVRAPLDGNTKFEDMDVDSLGLYSMVAGVEDDHDVIVNCGEFAGLEGVDDLADVIVTKINARMPIAKAA